MKREEILSLYGTDYKEMTKKILRAAGLESMIGNRDKKIGIKPNLVSPVPASEGATTHPEIVAGIIEYLRENGFHALTIIESSWVGDTTDDSALRCGYTDLAARYGVPFVDVKKDKYVPRDCAGMKLRVSRTALAQDFLINVPVAKGHCQTRVTCALKNLKGLLPDSEKRRFHALGLHSPIAHLAAGVRQDFIVIDHICGDWDCEDGGNPVVTNRIMAALDPVLIDTWVCRELGYETDDVPYIGMAKRLGVGSTDLTRAVIRELGGEESAGGARHAGKTVELKELVEDVDSCSACYAALLPALVSLKEEGLLDRLDTGICIGQGYRGKTGKLGVGSCTRRFACHLEGCPPTEAQIRDFLRGYLLRAN